MSAGKPTRKGLQFPAIFKHEHPPIQDINVVFEDQLTFGQRAADWVANTMGSWPFIVGQTVILSIWIVLNIIAWIRHWDPYPFILMNLMLSMQAAYAAPIIMMSQNRQAARDRLEAHNDYLINQKAEEEVRVVLDHLEAQDRALAEMHRLLLELETKINRQAGGSQADRSNPVD